MSPQNPQETVQDELLAAARKEATDALELFASALRLLLDDDDWSAPIGSATELERATSLTHTGAWQVYRLAQSKDPLSEAPNLPGNSTVKKLVQAAQREKIAPDTVNQVADAHRTLDRVMGSIARDRDTFVEMVAAWRGMNRSEAMDSHCRRAFKSACHVWGISAKASYGTLVIFESEGSPGAICLRGMSSLSASRRSSWDIYGSSTPTGVVRSALKGTDSDSEPLLTQFCDGPLPRLERSHLENWTNFRAHFEPTGEILRQSLLFGERYQVPVQDPDETFLMHCAFPTESMQIDVLAPRHWEPSVGVHGLFTSPSSPELVPDMQRLHSIATTMMADADFRTRPDSEALAGYPSMLETVLTQEGLDPDSFSLYRVSCKYPPTGSLLSMDVKFRALPG